MTSVDKENKLRWNLHNVRDLNLNRLQFELSQGARFVVFQYCVSPIVFSLKWPSRAYLIRKDDSVVARSFFPSLVSALFGWWSLPSGPGNAYDSLKINLRGGLDVTDDILPHLDEESLRSGYVTFDPELPAPGEDAAIIHLHDFPGELWAPAKKDVKHLTDHLTAISATIDALEEVHICRCFQREDPYTKHYFLGLQTGRFDDVKAMLLGAAEDHLKSDETLACFDMQFLESRFAFIRRSRPVFTRKKGR